MRRIAVLISNTGSGSNLQTLLDQQASGYNGQVVCVVSGKADAYGLVRAKEADVPTHVHDLAAYQAAGKPRAQFEEDLAYLLQKYSPDLIVLAGWQLILSETFLRYFPWRVINLHPGLLGDTPEQAFVLPNGQQAEACYGLSGENAIKAMLASGQPQAGSTVHAVVSGDTESGPVIKRGMVPIKPEDTVDSLYQRLKGKEHQILVESLRELCWVPAEAGKRPNASSS